MKIINDEWFGFTDKRFGTCKVRKDSIIAMGLKDDYANITLSDGFTYTIERGAPGHDTIYKLLFNGA